MSFPATRMRIRGAPKSPASLVRCRSTTAGAPSMIEAKSRVREHARNISRSTTQNAAVAPPPPSPRTRIPAGPVTQQCQSPSPISGPGPAPNTPLDHTFVGLSGGQIFHEMMLRHGVKHIFGYPGGAILPGAGHMAEGYARVSGKPGVVLVTSGPGATNVVTPMQDALSDGVPLVVFSGQVATSAIGSDAFQEADIVGISRSCTKWNVMVKDISELPRRINEAFKIATSGRPGPVLVDLPKDMLEPPTDAALIKQAAELINQAQRPVIYAGNGVLSSPMGPKLLAQLVEKGNIPVCTTLQGLGAFDETNERSLHMLGMHGSAYANFAMQQADVIIALGGRFDDRVTGKVDTFAPAARAAAAQGRGGIIHFEIQPKNINKVVEASIPVLGDVVTNLAPCASDPQLAAHRVVRRYQGVEEKVSLHLCEVHHGEGEKMKPQEVIEELDAQTAHRKEDIVISTGVGQHQMWAAQHFRWRHPRTMTMGFGLPAAIGAKVAAPHKTVVDIDGDASFSMTAMELATASQYGIGVKVLILNNEFQGMVVQWQDLFYEARYSHTTMVNPDFVLLAKSMGVHAIKCSNAEELPAKMKEFLEYDGAKPIVMECVVEKNEHVFPMVAAGKALHEQIMHPSLGASAKSKA
ncbi:acetolactate synthase [Infundibulicybe gibba]|nr:acetolactate synthase [Infundibulicybe gibba]